MSGHSKWSTIKHKKAATDAKRGKAFTKVIKEVTIAAKEGGGDPEGNPRLRTAIALAKSVNMPADNVKRAIMKGIGELPGVSYEEVVYEGYGPGGVAILIETLTDNRMRTTPEIRHLLAKYGGTLGEPGSVAWSFDRKGQLLVSTSEATEDRLMDVALEAGADDLQQEEGIFVILTEFEAFHGVQQALENAEIPTTEAKIVMEPQNRVELTGKKADQCIKLLEMIDEHDDVQNVFDNLELADDAGD
jgi:YebC/PmpR family DNA-binding regulatory protein